MKTKLTLLFATVVGMATLAASAQTPITETITGQAVPSPVTTISSPVYSEQAPSEHTIYTATFTGAEYQNSQKTKQLAQQLASAKSDSEKDKAKGELAGLLEKQFDQRQKRHEDEIKKLEAQIKKLKDLVSKRQENRREIISARLEQLVDEARGLGW